MKTNEYQIVLKLNEQKLILLLENSQKVIKVIDRNMSLNFTTSFIKLSALNIRALRKIYANYNLFNFILNIIVHRYRQKLP